MTKSDTKQDDIPGPVDPMAFGRIISEVAEQAQPLMKEFLTRYKFDIDEFYRDPLNMRTAYFEFMKHLWADPQKLAEANFKFWHDWTQIWQDSAKRFVENHEPEEEQARDGPHSHDRRFKSPLWSESPLFDFIRQSYFLTSKWAHEVVQNTEGLDENTRAKIDFMTRQYIDAIAPSNFILTNPEVLHETVDSKGENLIKGFKNLVEDLTRGGGELQISTTDYDAFELGVNIAVTPGKVIYQNDLIQLIQYEPTTDKVFKTPLLIIPPWINKYYILDLKPKNSYIKWLVDQGHTVFTISWVNPTRELAKKSFADYMEEGVLDALTQIKKVTGEPKANLISYCLGGTLLSVTLAWLAAKGKSDQIASATFLTTLIDFEKAGELKLFLDDAQLKLLTEEMEEKGFLPAGYLRKTFSMLRANDMIWSFVINNYLMGKEPFPFDLLYWNDDNTNMPAAMHTYYLRKCYNENRLIEPGGITIKGAKIDMRKVKTPAYFLSTKDDHIAPWVATYSGARLFSGPVNFTLSASGHVAGVVNPPDKNKYCYWTGKDMPETSEHWLEQAKQHDGSWWPNWQKWVEQYAGEKVSARKKLGGGKLEPIEDAPGSYVKAKAAEH